MNDEIEQLIEDVLSAPRAIEPSPAFAKRVIIAVQREAALPPLAFPWKRFVAAVVAFVLGMVLALVGGDAASAAVTSHHAWLGLFAAVSCCSLFATFSTAMPARRGAR
ncbi:MAG: hypothetical protein JO197_11770 [Acidobacteria bacterium]|nr:hypothetical protein [Acidobacteriota bacterium]MBV9476154.1 hypothetical protein [Acidobacteriota bacterium]